jgi:hypothetical protein
MAIAQWLGGLPGQLGVGLASIISSRTEGYVEALAYLLIASFAVALPRAWSLLQGRHLPANQDT